MSPHLGISVFVSVSKILFCGKNCSSFSQNFAHSSSTVGHSFFIFIYGVYLNQF